MNTNKNNNIKIQSNEYGYLYHKRKIFYSSLIKKKGNNIMISNDIVIRICQITTHQD